MRLPISKQLYEAAHKGDVLPLQGISRQYPSLLHGGSLGVYPFDRLPEPPLQVAAFHGNLDFVKRILELKPSLAHHSDDRGLSPLHMAVASGQLDIITHLLQSDIDLGFLCDENGRNSMHFAAMNDRLPALQLLVGEIQVRRNVNTFVNAKDNHGFTLLHLAVYNQNLEIVQYLLTLEIEVNALNSNGLTALDMLTNYPTSYPNCVRMANLLRGHGATCSSSLTSMTSPEIWARKKDALMVVASLIATMAFQAAVNPPGGVWQEDSSNTNNSSVVSSHQIAGKSVMATKYPGVYIMFITSASLAFMVSLIELLLHMSNTMSNNGVFSEILFIYTKYISTLSLVVAYWISVGVLTVLSGRSEDKNFGISLCVSLTIPILIPILAMKYFFVRRPSAFKTLIQFPPAK